MAQAEQHPRIPDPNEQFERSRQQNTEATSQNLAAQTGGDPSDLFENEDHWDKLSEFDIERETNDDIEGLLETELSNKYTLGQLTWEEWYRFGLWAENEIHTTLKEFPDADSKCTGTDYWIMYGKQEGLNNANRPIKPPLTDEDERRMWSAADAKKMGMTGAVDSRFLSALTEITAVSRTESTKTENKSRLQRLKEWL